MSSIPISQEGYKLMKKELEGLKKQRPEVSEAIRLAREEGDLRENGGYHAARERQGMMEARINFIESRMANYNVIDMKTLGGEKISFGATVELEDAESGEILADLTTAGEKVVLFKGGRGGQGNARFATATNKASSIVVNAPFFSSRQSPRQARATKPVFVNAIAFNL